MDKLFTFDLLFFQDNLNFFPTDTDRYDIRFSGIFSVSYAEIFCEINI